MLVHTAVRLKKNEKKKQTADGWIYPGQVFIDINNTCCNVAALRLVTVDLLPPTQAAVSAG